MTTKTIAMKSISYKNIASPKGFQATGIHCGLKHKKKDKSEYNQRLYLYLVTVGAASLLGAASSSSTLKTIPGERSPVQLSIFSTKAGKRAVPIDNC